MKRKLGAILLVVALVVTLGATGAFAAVVSTQDGDVCGPDISSYTTRVYIIDNSASKIDANPVIVAAPSDVTLHVYESDTETRVFNEAQNVLVTSLAYDGGTYTGNVDSHLVHQEPTMGEPGVPTPTPYADAMRGRGCIEFYTDIIGVIISDADLDASDSVLGLSTTTYPTGQVNRGLEMGSARGYQDIIEIDGKVLKIDLQSAEVMDQIRVLTEPVNPSIEVTKSGPTSAKEGETIDYTYEVHNDGDVPLDTVSVTDDKAGIATPVMGSVHNVGDLNGNDLLDPCETWVFTADYEVPWFYDCYTVENTATASASYEAVEVTDDSNTVVVNIVRNPAIEVTKSGPPETDVGKVGDGYFQTVEAEYTYEVENVGDCGLLNVVLSDNMTSPAYVSGDTGETGVMIPGEIWEFEATELLECECQTMTVFTNKATVTAEDVKGTSVDDSACWSVMVFQWLPRTIGFWGNWDNHILNIAGHYDMDDLVARVNTQSSWFSEEQTLTTAGVHDLLLTPPPKGKMDLTKAKDLFQKQLLAAWLSVKSYEGATDSGYGDLNWAMDPNALVYPPEAAPITVKDLLGDVESAVAAMSTADDIDDVLKFKDLLEDLNSAEANGYEMFIYPEFDADACPLELRENPPYKDVPDPGEDVAGSVVMVGDSTNDELVVFVYLDAGDTDYGVYLETYNGTTGGVGNWLDWDLIGTLTTDSHGHGSSYIRVPLAVISEPSVTGPDYYLQIVLSSTGAWGANAFGTDITTITIS